MSRYSISAAVIVALGVTIVSPSFAQPNAGMMGHGRMGPGGWSGGGWSRGPEGRLPKMGAMVEGRLAYLKGELNIVPEQEAAWDAYATAVTNRVELMRAIHQGMMETMQDGTAMERMDARISGMTAMLESLQAMKPATENLYAVLTEEQKAIADDLIGGDCGAF